MANDKNTPIPPAQAEETAELLAQIQRLQAEKAAAEAKTAELESRIESDSSLPKVVKGVFIAQVMQDGEPVKKRFGFVDGHRFIRFSTAEVMPTEQVIKLAIGGTVTAEEKSIYPNLALFSTPEGKDTGKCAAELQRLVDIEYGYLRMA